MKNKKGFTLIELLSVVVILGLLLAVAVPTVSKMVFSSRKKTLIETIQSYMSSLTVEVNNTNFYFSERNTVYAVPIECIDVDKGGTDPFGVWLPATTSQWAYVLVQFDYENGYTYGFTFKDNQGFGMYPVAQYNLEENGSQIISKIDISQPINGDIKSVTGLENWNGFVVDETTKFVVLQAKPKGEKGDGKNTCTLMQDVTVEPPPNPDPVNPTPAPTPSGNGPKCSLEVFGTMGANGWYKGSSPVVQFADTNSIVNNSDIVDYGIGLSTSNYDFNKNTSYVCGTGITTVYGYVKDKNGNVGACSVEIKYDDKVLTSTMNYGYQVYPKSDIATVSGQYITLNNLISEYGTILGANVYLKSNSSGMVVTMYNGSSTLATRTISAGVTSMNFSFSGNYNSLKIDMGSSSNISLIERIELITDHTTGFYTNYDVYAYAISSDSVYYSFNDSAWQTSNKYVYTSNDTSASIKTKDDAGNESSVLSFSINNIDKEKPVCESNTGSTTWAKERTVDAYCSDSFSDCRKEYYSVTYPTATVKNKKIENITIYDKAGNSNTCSVNVYVDSTNPVCTMNMTNSNGTVNSGATSGLDVTFKGSGADTETDASGINNVSWVVSGNGTTYSNLNSSSSLAMGTYQAYAICTDKAGNTVTTSTKTVTLKKVAVITFNSNGGSGTMADLECEKGESCTLTANGFTKTGNTFSGWSTSATGSVVYTNNSSITVDSDTTLYAKWSPVDYPIEYVLNGGTNSSSNPDSYTYGVGVSSFESPKKDGYVFSGWYTSSSLSTKITSISTTRTGTVYLYAGWEEEEEEIYSITYHLNGGTNSSSNPDSYKWGDVITFADPEKDGYNFEGWYIDSAYTTKKTGIISTEVGDVDLYAKWSVIETTSVYTLTYDSYGGTGCDTSKTATEGSAWGELCVPEMLGYNFDGWYTDTDGNGTKVTASSTAYKSLTVYAKWTPITYTIVFDGNGATNGSTASVTCTYDTYCTLTFNGFNKTDYYFTGWSETASGDADYIQEAEVKNLSSTDGGTATLYAVWAKETYMLRYDSQGGSACDPYYKNVEYGKTWGELCVPTKSGYNFDGWYTETNGGGDEITADTTVLSSLVVYAKWISTNYTLTYVDSYGEGCDGITKTASHGSAWGELCKPTRDNYEFGGWLTATEMIDEDTIATSDLTVSAHWVEIDQTLTYDNQGGSGCTSKISILGGKWGTLCTPTKSGYTFGGWYTETGGSGDKLESSSTVTGDLTAYAYWLGKPVFTCDSSAYSWSNVESSVDITATDIDNDFKEIYYRRYQYGEDYSSTTLNPFTFTGKYYQLQVYVSDAYGNQSSIGTSCYTKFDNIPYYTPMLTDAGPAKGDAAEVNVESITFSCTSDDGYLTEDRTCYAYITRMDTTKGVYDKYSWTSNEHGSTYESGMSPSNNSYVDYYYMDGSTCSDVNSKECDVYNVNYRVIYFDDEAGNVSSKLYVYSVWDN